MIEKILTCSDKMSKEYCCTVVQLGEIQEIPGANTVAKTLVNGRTIVIGKEHKEGEIMLYCSNESQLNFDFLSVNNLFSKVELNCNADEVNAWLNEKVDRSEDEVKEYLRTHRGYFNEKGRVRMTKLAGEISMGFLYDFELLAKWCPKLAELKEELPSMVGKDFDTVNGELFVKPYVPELKIQDGAKKSREYHRNKKLRKFNQMIPGQFSFHYDTQQFERMIKTFNPEDVVTISNKLHGCVERNTLVETEEFGKITIGEIVDNRIECKIKAFDTDLNADVFVPIDDYYLLKNDGEWYEIELEDGRKITITGNNPVWVPEINGYRRVDELNGDEYLQISE